MISGRQVKAESLRTGLMWPHRCVPFRAECNSPKRTSAGAHLDLRVHALPRPRRAAQRVRRLAEGADEGAAHPLRIAKAGYLRDALDRLAGGLHAMPGHLDPQPLHRVGVLSKPSSRRTVAISCPILSIIRPCFGQNCIECLAVRRPSGTDRLLRDIGEEAPMNSTPNAKTI